MPPFMPPFMVVALLKNDHSLEAKTFWYLIETESGPELVAAYNMAVEYLKSKNQNGVSK